MNRQIYPFMGVCIWTLENKYIISESGKCCEEKFRTSEVVCASLEKVTENTSKKEIFEQQMKD